MPCVRVLWLLMGDLRMRRFRTLFTGLLADCAVHGSAALYKHVTAITLNASHLLCFWIKEKARQGEPPERGQSTTIIAWRDDFGGTEVACTPGVQHVYLGAVLHVWWCIILQRFALPLRRSHQHL